MLKTGEDYMENGYSVERITFSSHHFTDVIRYQMEEIQTLYFIN